MEYLLKSTLICGIIYSFYKLFLQKETFFQSIRWYFIIGIMTSIIMPLLIIPIYIEIEPIVHTLVETSTNISSVSVFEPEITPVSIEHSFNWIYFLRMLYLLGTTFFLLKFIMELFSLIRIINSSKKRKEGKYYFVETNLEISPFSFFNHIVYNKTQFNTRELEDIIAHEKVHVRQKHSLDHIFIQLFVITQWFNPFAWLIKKEVLQNLEYIADKEAQEKAETHKKYQYLLLKTSIKNNPFALSNNFFNSQLKKRIMMLQKSQTKKLNQLKYTLLIPLIALFLYAFNTKEIFIPAKINSNATQVEKQKTPNFINPISKENITEISGYGMRIHPITKEKKMHLGVDLEAYKDMDVYATAKGVVITAAFDQKKGNYIQIKHANNYQTNYHHLGNIQVNVGDQVQEGEIIGIVGNTGESTGIHLHYEIMKDGINKNPMSYISYGKTAKKEKFVALNSKPLPRIQPTKKQLVSWENSNKFGVWIDGKRTDNNKLQQYLNTDFANYHLSKLAKNATNYGKYEYQINLMTNSYYTKYLKDNKQNKDRKAIKHKGIIGHNAIVNSKTSNKELKKIQREFKEKNNIEIIIYDVKRNTDNEIIAIKIDGKSKSTNSSFSYAQDYPISKVRIAYDKETDEIYIGNVEGTHGMHKKTTSSSHYSTTTMNVEEENREGASKNNENEEETTYIVNGKKVTKEAYERMDKSKIKNLSITKTKTSNSDVIIHQLDENHKTRGSINYKGETYYYSKSKPQNMVCSEECKEIKSKLSESDQKKMKKITKDGKTYIFYKNVTTITFYDRYGNDVSLKLAKKLMKALKNK